MSRTITVPLSEAGIKDAIKKLQEYKKWILERANILVERVAREIATEAQAGFSSAFGDDLLSGDGRASDATVTVETNGGTSIVRASGRDVVFVEFGTGVYHNTPAGSSPHPKGAELGLTIGSFGKGNGRKEVWGFYDGGELRLTHGTPAALPMYRAAKVVAGRIGEIAQEVFANG